ncbi:MAG: nuclear transport factor 2 family protein [Balneolaceae bacterium]|nr:nuclear transport factor 2 family protein [Balneolaceae bacterium]
MSIKVIVEEDCGNAPNKILLRDFKTAFVNKDLDALSNYVTNNITWQIMGEKKIKGIDNFKKYLDGMDSTTITELELNHIITNGKSCAMEGIIRRKDRPNNSFSEVYKLRGGKNPAIKEMTSYVIEVKAES